MGGGLWSCSSAGLPSVQESTCAPTCLPARRRGHLAAQRALDGLQQADAPAAADLVFKG